MWRNSDADDINIIEVHDNTHTIMLKNNIVLKHTEVSCDSNTDSHMLIWVRGLFIEMTDT